MAAKKRIRPMRALVICGVLLVAFLGALAYIWLRPNAHANGPLAVAGVTGTSQAVTIHLHAAHNIAGASVVATGDLAGMVAPAFADGTSVEANGDIAVPADVAIPGDKHEGAYRGAIELRDNGKVVASVQMEVTVLKASAQNIPADIAGPTRDRIATPDGGLPMVKDELLVGLNLNMIGADTRIKEIAAQNNAEIIGAIPETHSYQLRFPGISLDGLAQKHKDLEWTIGVSFVAYNTQSDAEALPAGDAYFTSPNKTDKPWDDQSNNKFTWGQRYIGLPKAWDKTTGSTGVLVGVIDSGFDFTHPDLKKNILPNAGYGTNYIKGTISSFKDPHGTNVAGTICADGDNAAGIAGVMWRCGLGLYDDGRFWYEAYAGNAKKTMHRAAKENMRVVNMSIGWGAGAKLCNGQPLPDKTRQDVKDANAALKQEIEWAKENKKDVLWVFAAGNSCRDASEVAPAALAHDYPDTTIAVAATEYWQGIKPTDQAHMLAQSNYGDTVSVAAPGDQIYTTTRKDPNAPATNENYYTFKSGTSLAAPFVSGLAGLELSAHPMFTSKQVKECIVDGATQAGQSVFEHDFKVINAPATLDCTPTPDPNSHVGSAQPCVFSFAARPESCESTDPDVTVRFTNVAGSQACRFESHLSWDANDKTTAPQVDTIEGLAPGQWQELGTHTFKEPGKYSIGHTAIPLTGGPCTILPGLYEFTLLPKR